MTDAQTELSEQADATDGRGAKDKTRRCMEAFVDYMSAAWDGECTARDVRADLNERGEDARVLEGNIAAIIAEPEAMTARRKYIDMLAATGDEETVRGLVEEAQAEKSSDPLLDCERTILNAFDVFLGTNWGKSTAGLREIVGRLGRSETQQLDKAIHDALLSAFFLGINEEQKSPEAENHGPVARLNVGLLSVPNGKRTKRRLNQFFAVHPNPIEGDADWIIDDVTEGTP